MTLAWEDKRVARLYTSFLVRCWHVGSGAQRIEVQHIASGTRTVADSFASAVDWMRARSTGEPAAQPAPSGASGQAPPDRAGDEASRRHDTPGAAG